MGYYAYHNPQATEAEREQHRRQVEFDATMKELEEWINVLLLRIQICRRGGPTEALLKGIDEAGDEFTTRLQGLMESAKATPYRLAAPTKNRY